MIARKLLCDIYAVKRTYPLVFSIFRTLRMIECQWQKGSGVSYRSSLMPIGISDERLFRISAGDSRCDNLHLLACFRPFLQTSDDQYPNGVFGPFYRLYSPFVPL